MVKNSIVLQDVFLNQVRREQIYVDISLINSEEYGGYVKGFDSFTVILETENKKQIMLYKHAITSVKPQKNVMTTNIQDRRNAI